MAETKKTETVKAETKDNRVEVFIPKGNSNDEPNLLVIINGKNYLLPKGKKSMVPPEVAYEINRSIEAQARLDAKIDEMLETAK